MLHAAEPGGVVTHDDDVGRLVEYIADALTRRDGRAYASAWGRASLILADTFEISPRSVDEIEAAVDRAWRVYAFLDVARVDARIVARSMLTEAITWVRVEFSFYDSSSQLLTRGDVDYTLRRDPRGLRCYIGTHLSAERNLAQLAHDRGYRQNSDEPPFLGS